MHLITKLNAMYGFKQICLALFSHHITQIARAAFVGSSIAHWQFGVCDLPGGDWIVE